MTMTKKAMLRYFDYYATYGFSLKMFANAYKLINNK